MDPEITKRLLALPSLREQAEREYASRVQTQAQDLAMQRAARLRGTEVEARLLASMDWYGQAWALREIGRLLGWDCGSETPQIFRFEDGFLDVLWRVGVGPDQSYTQVLGLPDSPFAIFCQPLHFPRAQKRHEVAGIATMDRPAAIAAILLHLSEGK